MDLFKRKICRYTLATIFNVVYFMKKILLYSIFLLPTPSVYLTYDYTCLCLCAQGEPRYCQFFQGAANLFGYIHAIDCGCLGCRHSPTKRGGVALVLKAQLYKVCILYMRILLWQRSATDVKTVGVPRLEYMYNIFLLTLSL